MQPVDGHRGRQRPQAPEQRYRGKAQTGLPRAEDLRWDNIRVIPPDDPRAPQFSPRQQQMSLFSFRVQRLLNTRRIQRNLKIIAALVVVVLAAQWLWQPMQYAAAQWLHELNRNVVEDKGFQIRVVDIRGHSHLDYQIILDQLDVASEQVSLQYDVGAARRRLERMGWIASARVRLLAPDQLVVEIVERQPTWVLKLENQYALIDANGHRIDTIANRSDWPHLPLLVGEGAETMVAEAHQLLRGAAPLGEVVGAVTRVGQRRWNLYLASGRVILLPEADPVKTLAAVVQLNTEQGLLNRDFKWLDVRNPQIPTLRLPANGGGDGA